MNFPEALPSLHTERLILRKLEIEDLPDFAKVVAMFPHRPNNDPVLIFGQTNEGFRKQEQITWGLEFQSELIGTIGFYRGFYSQVGEIGYALRSEFHGKGLMSEGIRAVLEYGRSELNLRGITAFTEDSNPASTQLLQRFGFERTEHSYDKYQQWSWFPDVQPGNIAIETERIRLRHWTEDDLGFIHTMNSHPEVMRFFPAPATQEESKTYLNRMLELQKMDGHTYYCAEEISSGRFMGTIGLVRQRKDYPYHPCVDLGWRLMPEFWGKGFATEGAQACLNWAWNVANLAEVRAFCPEVNSPSQSVMKRLNMQKIGTFLHPALEDYPQIQSCVAYQIQQPE